MKVVYFKGINSQWYWRLVAANGRVVADGAEGYDSKGNAQRGWRTVYGSMRVAAAMDRSLA